MEVYSYPADQAWAAAAAAYRINGNRYIKTAIDVMYDNKTLICNILEKNSHPVLDQDWKLGNEARDWWRNQLLMLLDDSANSYNKSAVLLAEKDTITLRLQTALLASLIKSYFVNLARQKELETKQALNSTPIADVGSCLCNFKVNIISCYRIVKLERNRIEATNGTYLFCWWSSQTFDVPSTVTINARLKSTENLDRDTGQVINQLNYVKVVNQDHQ